MSRRRGTPSAVWRVTPALLERLDERLGPPLDAYVRGWQVWLEPHGPRGETLEWRLHPPAGFRLPRGIDHNDLFDLVLQGLVAVENPATDPLPLGQERRTLATIWEVLEVFPAYGDDIAAEQLAASAAGVLGGYPPDAAGLADHDRLGDLWKGKRGAFSVGAALLTQLEPYEPQRETR
jgi:hypothetical protein